jgi:hypothetical protein
VKVREGALRGRRDKMACLLISDGTEFATDIAGMAGDELQTGWCHGKAASEDLRSGGSTQDRELTQH